MSQNKIPENQIGENLRFYGDMRFKQLTLLMAWLTVAVAGIVEHGATQLTPSISVRVAIACVSMLFTGVLWVMETRATLYWAACYAKAPEIWPSPRKPFWPLLKATNVVLFLYASVYVFWLWLGLAWDLPLWCDGVLAALLLALIVFSVVNCRRASRERNAN